MSAGCAEMRKPRKIGGFINFGETGDEPNTFHFYFQHNTRSFRHFLRKDRFAFSAVFCLCFTHAGLKFLKLDTEALLRRGLREAEGCRPYRSRYL
ncbi:MAG: hypothetical protein FWC50_08240 [Planctomycetaceae bacterium]|nr:hypothetical protein [Planctomycetaceae bacterium]